MQNQNDLNDINSDRRVFPIVGRDAIPSSAIKELQEIDKLLEKELRHVEASKLARLAAILDEPKAWSILLDELTWPTSTQHDKRPVARQNLLLDAVSINELRKKESPTLALLNHWAITGRRRPTVRTILTHLNKCNLIWARNFVCESILNLDAETLFPSPQRNLELMQKPIPEEYNFDNLGQIISQLDNNLVRYSFKSIYDSTNGFCHEPYDPKSQVGTKIGEGRFSTVFRATSMPECEYPNGTRHTFAAKLLKFECNKKYLVNEINLMIKVKHENVLQLLGIALGSRPGQQESYICLMYPLMSNGSLLDCLRLGLPTFNMKAISWIERVNVAVKVARGITYLHSFKEGSIIHRDIKTANIFLDTNLEPRVGDFTLVRQLENLESNDTQNVIGTSVYMPPEAFRGDISIKFDTFSFGVVILELITGLSPFDEETDEDLLTRINDNLDEVCDKCPDEGSFGQEQREKAKDQLLKNLLDPRAGDWDFIVAKRLFNLAMQATEYKKSLRPKMEDVLPALDAISLRALET